MRVSVAAASTSQKMTGLCWPQLEDAALESFVIDADAAVLDDDVGGGGAGKHFFDVNAGLVDDGFDIGKIADIAALLATVGVGLGECDGVSEAREVFVTATVICCRAIPVGGNECSIRRRKCSRQQLLTNFCEFTGAMVAGVAFEHGFKAAERLGLGGGGVAEQQSHGGDHLGGILDEEEIAGAEEMLGVLPGRGDERDAAGQRLENTNGGDAGDGGSVLLPRNVDGEPRRAVDSGRAEIRQIAAVAHVGGLERSKTLLRIANTVDGEAGIGRKNGGRLEEKFIDFGRALSVAPVADPDGVELFLGPGLGKKHGGVGGFVQRPDMGDSEALAIEGAERLAECEDAVEAIEAELAHLFRRRGGAVVGVVEEEAEVEGIARVIAQVEEKLGECGRIPFVEDYDVGSTEAFAPLFLCRVGGVEGEPDVGIGVGEAGQGIRAERFGAKVVDGPACLGFKDGDMVSESGEGAHQASQEMCVAVVPVGSKGVREIRDAKITHRLRVRRRRPG